jgi:hypothetical protein
MVIFKTFTENSSKEEHPDVYVLNLETGRCDKNVPNYL